MNSIEMSMAPHPFDEMRVTENDNDGNPTRADYYWHNICVFQITMQWDANGWLNTFKIIDLKRRDL